MYHSTKLWADALERQNSCHEPSDSEDKLLLLFGHIQWRLCTPNDMKLIFADPWLVMVNFVLSLSATRLGGHGIKLSTGKLQETIATALTTP